MSPIFSSRESEKRWVEHFDSCYKIDLGIHPCVFHVHESLKCSKPGAYTPQAVGLGPYHHFSPVVQQLESHKRAAVKEYLKVVDSQKFIEFVDEMPKKFDPASSFSSPENLGSSKFEQTIRSFYDQFLDLDRETLARIIIIDGIFLLYLLNTWSDEKNQRWPHQKNQRFVPDVLMLENQIPLNLLEEIRHALKDSFGIHSDIELRNEFRSLCERLSPLPLADTAQRKDEAFDKHMLHFMYKLIVNNYREPDESDDGETDEQTVAISPDETGEEHRARCLSKIGTLVRTTASQLKNAVKKAAESVKSFAEKARSSGLKIPMFIDNAAGFLQRLEKASDFYENSEEREKQLMAEEIDVPSVSLLHKLAKIKFAKVDGGIRNIIFDHEQNLLYLPVITLGENSEVILRNLMAYEAAAESDMADEAAASDGYIPLREYVDLMCGVIDSESDVVLLRKHGIIKGNLQNKEIVRIFNGINKSTVIPDEKSEVQNFVQKANELFYNIGIVKAYRALKKFLTWLWRFIKQVLYPAAVLVLLGLQVINIRSLSHAAGARDFSFRDESAFGLDTQASMMLPRKALRYTI